MKRIIATISFLLFLNGLWAHNHILPPGFVMEENFITGLEKPTDLKFAPDGRIFIAEKGGQILIVENGILLDQPFYSVATQTPLERGLGGLLLDPDFDNNGYVYLFYTLPYENKNVVARVTAAGNTAIPGSEIELIRFDNMWASWHNGGGMVFAPDGKLVIGTGDGTAGPTADDMDKTTGKIFRINPDGSIPLDNPFFTTTTGIYRGIAAYGVRNPYTMAVSRLSGKIFFNDVGQDTYEEINEFIPGKYYGWHHVEGYLNGAPMTDTNYIDPVHVYDHNFGCAVVGASFYEPDVSLFPQEYYGQYFFMDLCEGKVLYMDPDNYGVTLFGSQLDDGYNNLEVSPDGHLYLIHLNQGKLSRISYQGINAPPLVSIHPEARTVTVGEHVKFEVDATGDNLFYDWYVNGNQAQSSQASFFFMKNVDLADDQSLISVRVSNLFGTVYSDTVMLRVLDGSRPEIQFLNIPSLYSAGDSIRFAAVVTDVDQQTVPLSDLTWRVDFHHDSHVHPAMSNLTGTDAGSFFVETSGEVDTNVFYRIYLSVLDSSGLMAEAYQDVFPNKVTVQLNSEPEGIEVKVDGATVKTNFPLRSVKNLNRTYTVPSFSVVGDSLYQFIQWGDGADTLTRVFPALTETYSLKYQSLMEYVHYNLVRGKLHFYRDTASNQQYYRSVPITQVKQNWDVRSPLPYDSPAYPADYWSARWEWTTLAPVSDLYTFYLYHDSKVSLIVDGSLLINQAIASGNLQTDTVQMWFNAGDSLNFQLDYDHYTYLARVELDWSYSLVDRHPVPFSVPITSTASRLQGKEEPSDKEGQIFLFPNPGRYQSVNLCIDPEWYKDQALEVEVFDRLGRKWYSYTGRVEQSITQIPIEDLPSGIYLFRVKVGEEEKVMKFLRM